MLITDIFFKFLVQFLISIGICLGLLEWDKNPPLKKIKTRTKYLFLAAKKRGISMAILNLKPIRKYSNVCLVQRGHKKIIFETLPSNVVYKIDPQKIDNKHFLKKYLARIGLPVPIGEKFLTYRRAKKYAQKIGYPVVVKPVARSIFQGVSLNIQTEAELVNAIKEAKKHQTTFLVEKFIPGKSYRIMIVGKKIFVSLRQPATVCGDGKLTIRQLIKQRNNHKLRGPVGVSGWTLRQIDPKVAQKYLAKSKISLNYQPQKSEIVQLTDKINLGSGADIIDYTDKLHPKNYDKFLIIAEKLKTTIVGLDVIMDDPAKPWDKQTFYLIEANTIPSIDMHHDPLEGTSYDVAGEILDLLIREKFI